MKILVCGSRDWDDAEIVFALLDGFDRSSGPHVIIDGGAAGADQCAREWDMGEHETYPADWENHGRTAGPIRNQQMIDEGKPRVVLAFSDQPTSLGTADMIRRAKKAGVTVYLVSRP